LLKRTFGPKRDEETGNWRKLHTEELHNVYSSLNKNTIIESTRMRWAGHAARKEEIRNFSRKGTDQFGNLRVHVVIILKWILKKQSVGVDCIHLADDTAQWQSFVNTATNIWVPYKLGKLVTR
jgi:hypothetical protein